MTLQELRNSGLLPNRYKLVHQRGTIGFTYFGLATLIFLICALIFLFSDVVGGLVALILSAICGLTAFYLKKKIGHAFELQPNGIYIYDQKQLVRFVPYSEINRIETSDTVRDSITEVSLMVASKGRSAMNLTTVHCYNEMDELLIAMQVDVINELPLVIAMLTAYHPFLEEPFSGLTESQLKTLVKARTEFLKTYRKYEHYSTQPTHKLAWVYVLHWLKISLFSMLPFFVLGFLLGNVSSDILLALMDFIYGCGVFSILVAPFTFAFYMRAKNALYQYH